MATSNVTPQAETETKELRLTRKVFDLDSKDDVTVVKIQPDWTPVTTMHEFTARLGNDSAKILRYVNVALEEHDREALATDSNIPWSVEDEEGAITPFAGTLLSEKGSDSLASMVLNMAKNVFGFAKDKPKDQKRKAKEDARDMLLANPVVVESLKKIG